MVLSNNSTLLFANNITEFQSNTQTSDENSTEINSQNSTQNDNLNDVEDELDLISESCILIDASNGMILYQKDPHRIIYPASTTKILTTLLAIEYGKFDEIITHSHNAIYNIGPGSSHIGMREGEQITLWQALEGIMLESANEVCMAVAEHIGGSVENFVDMMNKKAKEVGATDSHFNNPHGFHDDNHYTTAYDMAMIMKEAIKHEEFVKLISTVSSKIPPTNIVDEIRYLNNSNKMLKTWSPYYYENIVGSKTGFTDEAGNTLVSYAEKDGIKLIASVMKDKGVGTYTDTKTLFEYGFSQYDERQIFNTSQYSGKTNVIQNFHDKEIDLGEINVIPENNLKIELPKSIPDSDIRQEINLKDKVEAPVNIGDEVGKIIFYYDKCNLGSIKLLAGEGLNKVDESILLKQEQIENMKKNIILGFKITGLVLGSTLIILIIVLIILNQKEKKQRIKSNKRKKRRLQYSQNNHEQQ